MCLIHPPVVDPTRSRGKIPTVVLVCDGRGLLWIIDSYLIFSTSLCVPLSPSLSSHPLSLCPPNCEKPARSAYATRSVVAKERGRMRGERGRERVRETVVFRFCAAIVCSSLYSCVQTVIQSQSYTAPLAVQPMHVCFIRVCVFGI